MEFCHVEQNDRSWGDYGRGDLADLEGACNTVFFLHGTSDLEYIN